MTEEKWGRTIDTMGRTSVRVMEMGEGHIALTLLNAGNTVLLTERMSGEIRQALEQAEAKAKEFQNG